MVRIRGCWKHKDKGHKGKVDIGCLTPQAQAHHNHPREAYLPSIVSTRALKLPLSQNGRPAVVASVFLDGNIRLTTLTSDSILDLYRACRSRG